MRFLRLCTAIVVLAAFLPIDTHAQFAEIGGHTRLSDMNNAEANGGGDTSLIGVNPNGINNFGINQWDLSSITGDTVTEVTLTFVTGGIGNTAVIGSDLDTISIHLMHSTNAGWLEGSQVVNANNVETNGAATYNFRAQTSETVGTPWQDASGADLPNLLGAFDPTPIDSIPGYNDADRPVEIEFTIPIALAQSWVDDPASFAGIVLLATDNGDGMGRFNFLGNPAVLSINPAPDVLLGDVDLSGTVDFADISPFITRLSDDMFQAEADTDLSGMVDFGDISSFISILAGSP